jgi:hypothetical protein
MKVSRGAVPSSTEFISAVNIPDRTHNPLSKSKVMKKFVWVSLAVGPLFIVRKNRRRIVMRFVSSSLFYFFLL